MWRILLILALGIAAAAALNIQFAETLYKIWTFSANGMQVLCLAMLRVLWFLALGIAALNALFVETILDIIQFLRNIWMQMLFGAIGIFSVQFQVMKTTLWEKFWQETLLGKFGLLKKGWTQLKKGWTFLRKCLDWLYYPRHLTEMVQALEDDMVALFCVGKDIIKELNSAVIRTGHEPKREVSNWLKNVVSKRTEVVNFVHEFRRGNQFSNIQYCGRVTKHIREVKELSQQGKILSNSALVLEAPQPKKLLTSPLVGDSPHKIHLENLLESLVGEWVSIIGVVGVKGIGKTSILMHAHNQLLALGTFKQVCWVTLARECDVEELQNEIAEALGIDLPEGGNEIKREARAKRLYGALKGRKRSVLFLDDLKKKFALNEVGIPTGRDGCKFVLTTCQREVCQDMGCEKMITVQPLGDETAKKLFMVNLQLNKRLSKEFESYAEQMVKACDGIPGALITEAEKLRGMKYGYGWRNALYEKLESKAS